MRWFRPGYALVLVLLLARAAAAADTYCCDAVSTPRPYVAQPRADIGARATPQNFAVALASHLVNGVVVKALLRCWGFGWRAGRGPTGRNGTTRSRGNRPVCRDHAGDLESYVASFDFAGPLEPAGRMVSALGCDRGVNDANNGWRRLVRAFGLAFWVALAA